MHLFRFPTPLLAAALLLAGSIFPAPAALASDTETPQPHCHGPATGTASATGTAPGSAGLAIDGLAIPDTVLLDQDGKEVRFGSDLVDGKVVAVNFVFTTCTTICPPMGANFGKLQELLGERAGRDVHLVSVSIDPAVDTPARLAAWGERFGASDAWTLVTGDKPRVDELLQKLGVFVAEKQYHSPIVLLGNARTGEWRRANGLTPAAELLTQIEALASSPAELAHQHEPSSAEMHDPANTRESEDTP